MGGIDGSDPAGGPGSPAEGAWPGSTGSDDTVDREPLVGDLAPDQRHPEPIQEPDQEPDEGIAEALEHPSAPAEPPAEGSSPFEAPDDLRLVVGEPESVEISDFDAALASTLHRAGRAERWPPEAMAGESPPHDSLLSQPPAGAERSPEEAGAGSAHDSASDAGRVGGSPGGTPLRTPLPRGVGSVTMDPLIGRVIGGRYEIVQRIGSGGMGAVYRARQASVARHVALKVLRPDLISNDHIRQRFHREAEIIGRLSHPNTIRLYEFCTTEDGLAVMVMELLDGQPLSERLKSQGPMDLSEGLTVGSEVARSLAEAHHLGLVHRDLKPANIFLHRAAGQQITKVLDFGIARLMDEEATRLTVTDQVFGTPRYMSPEQGLSTANVDARSDLYSLGLILYECVVGQPPFVAQTSFQYLSAHSAQPPPKLRESLPTAPEALEQLIDACLRKKPDDRPQTAAAIALQLDAIRSSVEVGSPPPPPLMPLRDPSGARGQTDATAKGVDPNRATTGRIWLVAAALVVLGLVGLGIALATHDSSRVVAGGAPDAGWADSGTTDPNAMLAVRGGPDASESIPDAGRTQKEVDGPPDASAVAKAPPKKRTKRRPSKRKSTKRRTAPPSNRLTGPGVVSGPRALYLETNDEQSDDLLRKALGCKTSIHRGVASLTTQGCPTGCAILIDETCGGRTPAEKRPMPPGKRDIAVICRGKVQRIATLTFVANDVTLFRCR